MSTGVNTDFFNIVNSLLPVKVWRRELCHETETGFGSSRVWSTGTWLKSKSSQFLNKCHLHFALFILFSLHGLFVLVQLLFCTSKYLTRSKIMAFVQ